MKCKLIINKDTGIKNCNSLITHIRTIRHVLAHGLRMTIYIYARINTCVAYLERNKMEINILVFKKREKRIS